MQRDIAEWLVHLADPLGPRTEPPRRPLALAEARLLVAQADLHGLLPFVLGNFNFPASPEFEAVRAEATVRHQSAVGFSLVLRRQARQIISEAVGLPVILVKGSVIAHRLYPDPRRRRFTDIDLLASPEALAPLALLLAKLGYVQFEEPGATGAEEWKWFHRDRPGVMVEVQTNLIHSKTLQGGLWLRYGDLVQDGDPTKAEEPAALLAVAAIHGAGHQYERLLHVVDILQAARHMTTSNEKALEQLLARTGGRLAAVTGLDLAGRLFREPRCIALAQRLGSVRGAGLARRLIRPQVVTSTMSARRSLYSWRRSLYRELLKARGWLDGPPS